jgi:mevalonate kinase
MPSFYSHGKLLITAEYAVLAGAKALAIPCKKGHYLNFQSENNSKELSWNSYDFEGQKWFEVNFYLPSLEIMKSSDQNTAKRLQEILIFATKENPFFLLEGGKVKTYLEFNNLWGLGSSSSLIVNIASWAKINPYKLLNSSFGGSGYDVACGLADGPIFYSKKQSNPKVESVSLSPIFFEKLYFVYLNKKADSQKAVQDFDLNKVNTGIIKKLDNLTKEMSSTYDINKFENAMEEHEKIIGCMINKRPIKDVLFSNFTGGIKSLGAWGGDFILVTENENRDTEKYFKKLGYNTVIPWKEMSLVH